MRQLPFVDLVLAGKYLSDFVEKNKIQVCLGYCLVLL